MLFAKRFCIFAHNKTELEIDPSLLTLGKAKLRWIQDYSIRYTGNRTYIGTVVLNDYINIVSCSALHFCVEKEPVYGTRQIIIIRFSVFITMSTLEIEITAGCFNPHSDCRCRGCDYSVFRPLYSKAVNISPCFYIHAGRTISNIGTFLSRCFGTHTHIGIL